MLINILIFAIVCVLFFTILSIYFFNRNIDRITVVCDVFNTTITNYCDVVFLKKVKELAKQHNLNPDSKMNSILSYQKKLNNLISDTTVDIIRLLPNHVHTILNIYYTDKALALIISNKLSQIIS